MKRLNPFSRKAKGRMRGCVALMWGRGPGDEPVLWLRSIRVLWFTIPGTTVRVRLQYGRF